MYVNKVKGKKKTSFVVGDDSSRAKDLCKPANCKLEKCRKVYTLLFIISPCCCTRRGFFSNQGEQDDDDGDDRTELPPYISYHL